LARPSRPLSGIYGGDAVSFSVRTSLVRPCISCSLLVAELIFRLYLRELQAIDSLAIFANLALTMLFVRSFDFAC
ncbi:hypothetical protein, partial [uncultured Ellagibacter sp.]|uniref:hypothetical protein n=1 Tax=uncultured Ellagibacter sp. TaxID=2137580 RepID=UPI0026255E81